MKNMKFKVDSPEQSERLQKGLFGLGYSKEQSLPGEFCIVTYEAGFFDCYSAELFEDFIGTATDTAAFLAAHEPAPATEQVAIKHLEFPWFDNTGTMPDLPEGTRIDIKFREGSVLSNENATGGWFWKLDVGIHADDIVAWRYHRPCDKEYFVQPKTEPKDASKELFEGIANHDGFTAEAAHNAFAGVKRNKYMREIKPGVYCDVYDLLRAFNVTDGALAHMVKKCLAVGQRGHKDATEDYKDIVASAQRALELHLEWKETK